MSAVVQASQLRFDWDHEASDTCSTRAEVPAKKQRVVPRKSPAKLAMPASPAPVVNPLPRIAESTAAPSAAVRVRRDRAQHIGGLMLDVLSRYGITQDEFLDEYERQMALARS